MRIRRAAAVIASVLAPYAFAQGSQGQSAAAAVGTWRGTSVCLVRPSPCNDEIVVYRIAPTDVADRLTIDARKIVHGEEQEMGVLSCPSMSGARVLCCRS
jgi:hypothetical protein